MGFQVKLKQQFLNNDNSGFYNGFEYYNENHVDKLLKEVQEGDIIFNPCIRFDRGFAPKKYRKFKYNTDQYMYLYRLGFYLDNRLDEMGLVIDNPSLIFGVVKRKEEIKDVCSDTYMPVCAAERAHMGA